MLRRLAISRKPWLPVSAHECEASATIEAEPVITAAIDLATATARLANRAMSTVRVLSLPPNVSAVECRSSVFLTCGGRRLPSSAEGRTAPVSVVVGLPVVTAGELPRWPADQSSPR